jgi:hypothetical protein
MLNGCGGKPRVGYVLKVTVRKSWNRTFRQAEPTSFSENRQSPVRPGADLHEDSPDGRFVSLVASYICKMLA